VRPRSALANIQSVSAEGMPQYMSMEDFVSGERQGAELGFTDGGKWMNGSQDAGSKGLESEKTMEDALRDWKGLQGHPKVRGGLIVPTPVGLRPMPNGDRQSDEAIRQPKCSLGGIVEEVSGEARAAMLEDEQLLFEQTEAERKQDMMHVSKALKPQDFEMEKHASAPMKQRSAIWTRSKDKQRWGRPASAATRLQTLHEVSKFDMRPGSALRRSQTLRPQSATVESSSRMAATRSEGTESEEKLASKKLRRPATAQAMRKEPRKLEYQLSTCNLSEMPQVEDREVPPRPRTAPPRQNSATPSKSLQGVLIAKDDTKGIGSRRRTSDRPMTHEQFAKQSDSESKSGVLALDSFALGPLAPSAREVQLTTKADTVHKSSKHKQLPSDMEGLRSLDTDLHQTPEGCRNVMTSSAHAAACIDVTTDAMPQVLVPLDAEKEDERWQLAKKLNIKLQSVSQASLQYQLVASGSTGNGEGHKERGKEKGNVLLRYCTRHVRYERGLSTAWCFARALLDVGLPCSPHDSVKSDGDYDIMVISLSRPLSPLIPGDTLYWVSYRVCTGSHMEYVVRTACGE